MNEKPQIQKHEITETRVYYSDIMDWLDDDFYDELTQAIDATYNPGTLDTALVTAHNFIEACENADCSEELINGLKAIFEGTDLHNTYVDIT